MARSHYGTFSERVTVPLYQPPIVQALYARLPVPPGLVAAALSQDEDERSAPTHAPRRA